MNQSYSSDLRNGPGIHAADRDIGRPGNKGREAEVLTGRTPFPGIGLASAYPSPDGGILRFSIQGYRRPVPG
jgi:hypothetical protein